MQNTKKLSGFWFWLFVLPALSTFIIVVIIPFTIGIFYSFVSRDGLGNNPMSLEGVANYFRILKDTRFRISFLRTILFTFVSVVSINILGFLLALLVTTKLKVCNIARTMFFMPNLIGGLILGFIWKFLLSDAFKSIGEYTGATGLFFNWLLDPQMALFSLSVVITWQMAGYVMIIYITGMQAVPEEVMEAATIDGAGYVRKLFFVKLPLIMPSITICLFYSLSNCFKNYDINLALTGGGPGNTTELLAMNIYNEIFSYNNYGYGQAKAIMFFLLITVVSICQVMISKRREVQL